MEKIWKVLEGVPANLKEKTLSNLPGVVADILWNRGVISEKKANESVESYLNPSYEKDLFDPLLLRNMPAAVKLLGKTLKEKKKIFIYGDFDVDGVCGSAILYETLKLLDADVSVYIPDRVKEGYGVNTEAIEDLNAQGAGLIITVDCGITSKEELKASKCEIIVVDHHEPQDGKMPDGIVVNPKQKNDKYPFKDLAAAALAWKFSQAILQKIKIPTSYKLQATTYLKWQLDLVALATICDVTPLVSENRLLASFGLKVLRKTKRIGLLELFGTANIIQEKIGSYEVGFLIGPRLNAPGRIDSASISLELLITKDQNVAQDLAKKANDFNLERQKLLEQSIKEAIEKILELELHHKKVILVGSEKWPSGIVGLVAGKISQTFYRPTLVYEKGPEISKGSARSIEGYNLVENLKLCEKFLLRFGGHAKAAGFALENGNEESFYAKILETADQSLKDSDLQPTINIDAEIKPDEINLEIWDNYLVKLEPYGLANPKPVFLIKSITLSDKKLMGKEHQHVRLIFNDDYSNRVSIVAFGWGKQSEKYNLGQRFEAVVTCDLNEWQGTRKVEYKIIDLRLVYSDQQ